MKRLFDLFKFAGYHLKMHSLVKFMHKGNNMSHVHFYTDSLYNNIIKDINYRSIIDRGKKLRQKGYRKKIVLCLKLYWCNFQTHT